MFGGDLALTTYAQMGPDPADADRILHGQLETPAGHTIMAADVPQATEYQPMAGCMVSLSGDDADALRGYWEKLSGSGTVTMPMERQAWGDEFGMCVDQFGVPWVVNIASPQT